ncbi:MAG: hypothetical protein Q8K75_04605 [Chlamydiales bacterium]|nr:hypothetical protein [Chlamydiales bacterium]
MRIPIFLLFLLCISSDLASGTPFCPRHGSEIRLIKSRATEALYNAHRAGGRLFRETYSRSVLDIARDQVEYTNTYSTMARSFENH